MRLVLDQGVPRDAAVNLRNLGYDCLHVGEIGMSKAADEEILAFSLGRSAVVVTLDADFHAILAVSGVQGPSVIRMRLQGLGISEVVEVVQKVLAGFEGELKRGCLITVKAFKVTCRRLAPRCRKTQIRWGRRGDGNGSWNNLPPLVDELDRHYPPDRIRPFTADYSPHT
jgi:predicted nuclease of predicted toxin-antitoxin system